MRLVRTVSIRCVLHCTECALNNGRFIELYRSDPAMYITLRAAIMQSDTLCSLYKSFKLLFHHYTVSKHILHGKIAYSVHSVCYCIEQKVR